MDSLKNPNADLKNRPGSSGSKYSAIVFTVDPENKEKESDKDSSEEDDDENYDDDFEDDFEPYETSNEDDKDDKTDQSKILPPPVVIEKEKPVPLVQT